MQKLLAALNPELNPGEFVFCLVELMEKALLLGPLCSFQEKEGVTVILPRAKADETGISYSLVCAWITLTVHSSLEGVGLTAAYRAPWRKRASVATWWQPFTTINCLCL